MGKLIEKFDKLSDDEKTNISMLIHGIDNVIELDDKLIFDNHSEPMDESEYLQLSNIVSKYYDDNEWELIHCNLSSKFKNTRVIDSQYTRTYNHVKNSLNWDFIPYNVDDLKHKREKVFLFYNGSCDNRAVHRLMSFHYLLEYGIIDKLLYSLLEKPTEQTYSDLDNYESHFKSGIDWRKYDNFFQQAPFLLDVNVEEHNFVDLGGYHSVAPQHSLDLSFNHIKETYFSLVTESFFFEPHWCEDKSLFDISEKTYKSVLTQPFIIMGRPGILKYLRKKGFDTFDDVFDNSYDEVENDWERFQLIMKEVNRVCNLEQETLHEIYLNCIDRVVFNQEKFFSYKGEIE
tara:strand:- start:173 stop:1207 length:1035 start_codon:yes stop_codon:yes gene_type:complete